MRNQIKRLLLLFTILVGVLGIPVIAGSSEDLKSYNKGIEAYESGDYTTAFKHLRPLADRGHAVSQFTIGDMYFEGKGVEQNYKAAIDWYTVAAENGSSLAQFNLASMYYEGLGVTQDFNAAFSWHKLAAEQGVSFSQFSLGQMYLSGNGAPQDIIRAHMWWNLAALNGFKAGVKNRDILENQMSASDVLKANELARNCQVKKFKDC